MKITMSAGGRFARQDPDSAVHQANANGEWAEVVVAPVPISCVQTTLDWA
jgi:hypothetical protein